ncbi:hypothetical protein ACFCV3_38045 [Kribbella sp. NPDC056345]|uniref:hypothetical protein n=1 Tax=Kribbella sp. NPDC056345 TaxID=3345789 RepID=UPI0035E278CB
MLIVTGPATGGRGVGVGRALGVGLALGVGVAPEVVGGGVALGVVGLLGGGELLVEGAGTSASGAVPVVSEHPANATSTITTTPASLTRRR